MGAIIRRFKPAERQLLADVGTDGIVGWKDVAVRKLARVTGPIETDANGYEYVMAVNESPTTRTLSRGAVITLTPKHVWPRWES